MKNLKFLIALLITGTAFQACQNANRNNRDAAATMPADSVSDTTARAQAYTADVDFKGDEKSFILSAATTGMMEVEAGKIALQKANNKAVKSFAALVVKEHTKTNAELEKIAKAKGIAFPAAVSSEQSFQLKQMSELTGRSFDTHYIQMMINDHAETESMYGQLASTADKELKNFVLNTFPVIQTHHKMAVKIGKDINITNANNGDDNSNINPDSLSQKH